MKHRTRRIIGVVIIFICIITTLSGCSSERLEAFADTDLVQLMKDRINANKAIANRLYTAGLITESERDSILKTIDSQLDVFLSDKISTSTTLQNRIFGAVVDWSAPEWNKSRKGYKEDEWEEEIITTYVAKNNEKLANKRVKLFKGKGTVITPIEIVKGKVAEDINDRFGYKVYILRPFGDVEGGSGKSLDETIDIIAEATKNKDKVNTADLEQLFELAVDEHGNPVTLLDLTKRKNRIVGYSTGSTLVTDETFKYDKNGKVVVDQVGNEVKKDVSVHKKSFNTPDAKGELPGHDMVVKDRKTGKIPMMAIRFREFNSEAVDNIIKTLGMNPDQYLFYTKKGDNRVYIMEYPIYYVSAIREKPGNINEYICDLEKSNIGINVRTGKLIKYGKAWGKETDPAVYLEDNDPYLQLRGAKSHNEEGRSAFVVQGATPKGEGLEVGENKQKVRTGRIVLRDYLEATYAPGVVGNENVAVLGRKIRILQFEGSKKNVMAKYYGKDGKQLEKTGNLYVNDFADLESLAGDKPIVKYIGSPEEAKSTGDGDTGSSEGVGGHLGDIKDSILKIEELDEKVVTKINPTTQFPGKTIGRADNNSNSKPLFYAMAVKKNMFSTALFSGWIMNESSENSLKWWIEWLAHPNRTYKYTINKNSLEDYLVGNYAFELNEAGIIVLDLETISKIQQEYKEQDRKSTTRWFRTTFVVIGWAILCYAMILMLAWVIDVNFGLGIGLLEIVSFGNWVAVRGDDGIPYDEVGTGKYVTFNKMLPKTIRIAIIGILLIFVNVIDVVVYLIDIFGGAAKVMDKLIRGV